MRFDAPLLSFGGTMVDAENVTDEMPSRAMVTGLLGNALGWDHRDVERLERLQQRVRLAARRDVEGERIVDFQTVDLGQDFLREGWTTWGRVEGRAGGTAATGTHIRHRHYLADAVYTAAITLVPEADAPDVAALGEALDAPARPLFLGRKACPPATAILLEVVDRTSLFEALVKAPLGTRRRASAHPRRCLIRVPAGTVLPEGLELGERAVTQDRDWPNQIHVGRSIVMEGMVECGVSDGG